MKLKFVFRIDFASIGGKTFAEFSLFHKPLLNLPLFNQVSMWDKVSGMKMTLISTYLHNVNLRLFLVNFCALIFQVSSTIHSKIFMLNSKDTGLLLPSIASSFIFILPQTFWKHWNSLSLNSLHSLAEAFNLLNLKANF